jgi:hypothetical protein
MHRMIRAMRILIAINTWRYGKGASREALRDLQGKLNSARLTAGA